MKTKIYDDWFTLMTEQETILSYSQEDKTWYIYSDVPKHARKYEKIIPADQVRRKGYRNGNLVMIDGYVDEKAVTVSIHKKRVISDEERQKLAERARKNLANWKKGN